MKIIEKIREHKAAAIGAAVGVGLSLFAAPAMAAPTPGPAVEVVDDAIAQIEFDALATMPNALRLAGILFGAFLLWRIVRKYVRP